MRKTDEMIRDDQNNNKNKFCVDREDIECALLTVILANTFCLFISSTFAFAALMSS